MIHAPEDDAAAIAATCAGVTAPHALVEVSDRELSFGIAGPQAAELLTLGCPRDPDSIAVGAGRRTVFDGATVILWRDGPDAFRMDVWRSFAPHVLHLLETGCRELALD
jgi:sarcosine oxidase subunit gamma